MIIKKLKRARFSNLFYELQILEFRPKGGIISRLTMQLNPGSEILFFFISLLKCLFAWDNLNFNLMRFI